MGYVGYGILHIVCFFLTNKFGDFLVYHVATVYHKGNIKNWTGLRQPLQGCSGSASFEAGWKPCNGRSPALRSFAGTLATMFPNTATVESDFSLIRLQKTDYRTSLTDFSLEGCLHAKQPPWLSEVAQYRAN